MDKSRVLLSYRSQSHPTACSPPDSCRAAPSLREANNYRCLKDHVHTCLGKKAAPSPRDKHPPTHLQLGHPLEEKVEGQGQLSGFGNELLHPAAPWLNSRASCSGTPSTRSASYYASQAAFVTIRHLSTAMQVAACTWGCAQCHAQGCHHGKLGAALGSHSPRLAPCNCPPASGPQITSGS